jgi:hypothetical protein
MGLKSRFRFWAFLIVGVLCVLSSILLLFFMLWIADVRSKVSLMVLFSIGLLSFIWLWLFLGELRTKAVAVKFEDGFVRIKRFMGLTSATVFELKEFDGYTTCLLPSRSGFYEYLYLIKNGKRQVKLSEFYHSNYSDLKKYVSKEISFLGKEDFSYRKEIKEIFVF